MRNLKNNQMLTSVALVVIGLLFVVYKSEVISIAMSLIGITMVIIGALDLIRKFTVSGIVKIVIGALVLTAGWLFVSLALYLLGAFLLVVGGIQLYSFVGMKIKKITLPLAMNIAQPLIYVLVGICLFFNQGGTLSGVFTISGIFLIIDGALGIVGTVCD